MSNEIKFDLTRGTKTVETKAKNVLFNAQKEVITTNLKVKIAEINSAAATEIQKVKTQPDIIAVINDQVKEMTAAARAESNVLIARLCQRHNKTTETLEESEQLGIYVAKKIQGVKDTKLGRVFRGFCKGISDGWNK